MGRLEEEPKEDGEDEHPDEAEMMATIKEKPILQMTDEEQNGVQKKKKNTSRAGGH